MEYNRCYIVGAGEFCIARLPEEDDFVIAADAGYLHLKSLGIVPDLVVGDFDSLGYVPDHRKIIKTEEEKDDTDMMTAVKEGLGLGFRHFIINGGVGDRLDHFYANTQTLCYLAENGARGILTGHNEEITVIKNEKLTLETMPEAAKNQNHQATKNRSVSVFAVGDKAKDVTLKGFKYPLSSATLFCNYPIGCSNEITEDKAEITVEDGTLLIIY